MPHRPHSHDKVSRQRSPPNQQSGKAGSQSPEKFARHFQNVQWPASKTDLMAQARSTAAPDEIIRGLQQIRGDTFSNLEEVLVAYEDEFSGSGPSRPGMK